MTSTPPMPTDVAAFLHRITAEYENLSRQLKLIARHVEAHRDHLGLEGIQDVAAQCGVQPSAVVRAASAPRLASMRITTSSADAEWAAISGKAAPMMNA